MALEKSFELTAEELCDEFLEEDENEFEKIDTVSTGTPEPLGNSTEKHAHISSQSETRNTNRQLLAAVLDSFWHLNEYRPDTNSLTLAPEAREFWRKHDSTMKILLYGKKEISGHADVIVRCLSAFPLLCEKQGVEPSVKARGLLKLYTQMKNAVDACEKLIDNILRDLANNTSASLRYLMGPENFVALQKASSSLVQKQDQYFELRRQKIYSQKNALKEYYSAKLESHVEAARAQGFMQVRQMLEEWLENSLQMTRRAVQALRRELTTVSRREEALENEAGKAVSSLVGDNTAHVKKFVHLQEALRSNMDGYISNIISLSGTVPADTTSEHTRSTDSSLGFQGLSFGSKKSSTRKSSIRFTIKPYFSILSLCFS